MSFDLNVPIAVFHPLYGAGELKEHFKNRPLIGPCPKKLRIPVFLRGYISGRDMTDDGYSDDGFLIHVDKFVVAPTGKEDSVEAFAALLDRTAASFEMTEHNKDVAPIFRALSDRFNQLLEQANV